MSYGLLSIGFPSYMGFLGFLENVATGPHRPMGGLRAIDLVVHCLDFSFSALSLLVSHLVGQPLPNRDLAYGLTVLDGYSAVSIFDFQNGYYYTRKTYKKGPFDRWFPLCTIDLAHSMSSRLQTSGTSALLLSSDIQIHDPLPPARSPPAKVWVDPATLPNHHHSSSIAGNAPDYVKQLTYNTFMSYGVGEPDSFGYKVGRSVKFIEANVSRKTDRNERLEAVTIAEIEVVKHMLNGAGMLHGGCIAYLIDICCGSPLVVLGLIQGVNGVGATQSLNIQFLAPASRGTTLRIISTSTSLGGRVMSSRCEVVDKESGRMVASAIMCKMQPISKL